MSAAFLDVSSIGRCPPLARDRDPSLGVQDPDAPTAIAKRRCEPGCEQHSGLQLAPVAELRADKVCCNAYRCDGKRVEEIEFPHSAHAIAFFPDGMSGECSWRNGHRSDVLPSLVPNAIIVNAAEEPLRIRMARAPAPFRLLLVTISPQAMDAAAADEEWSESLKATQRIGVKDEALRWMLSTVLLEIEFPGRNSKSYGAALLKLLVCQLARNATSPHSGRKIRYSKGGLPAWRLKAILELLEGDPRKSYSLAELANHVHLQTSFFCRAFKQSTGVSPHQYFLLHKIRCAKEMMRDRARSLTEIALECGFCDSSHFSTAFRQKMGTSPSEYRRAL